MLRTIRSTGAATYQTDFTSIRDDGTHMIRPNTQDAFERLQKPGIDGFWAAGFLVVENLKMRELCDQLREEGFTVEIKC